MSLRNKVSTLSIIVMGRKAANDIVVVRALVEQRLQTELSGDRRAFLDRQIDNELANM